MSSNHTIKQSLPGIHLSLLMNLEAKFRDDENRLLGENKVSFEYHTDVAMELVECPYTGSRHKHYKPMNVSALKQITSHWNEILNGFSCLRSFHLQQKLSTTITALDLYKLAVAGYLMPSYLFYRAKDAFADGELPAFVATIYKASLGLVNAAQVFLTKHLILGEYIESARVNPEAFYLFAENEKLFIGPWEVCAGTPNQIKEILAVMSDDKIDYNAQIPLISNLERYFHYITQAEKVVLLDNFFSIIFYFYLSNNKSNHKIIDLFKILQNQDKNTTQPPRELSMELQFLDLVCPILDEKPLEQKEKIQQNLVNLFNNIDSSNDISSLITQNEKEKQQAYTQVAFNFFSSDDVRISRKLSKEELETVIYILVNYLILERKKITLYSKYQIEMNSVLERTEVERPIDSLDITLMYGKKLRDILASFLAVEIDNLADKTVIKQGNNQIILD